MIRYPCPVCKLYWKDGQDSIQCSTCLGWVHHNNRRNCSGLTDDEFLLHFSENEGLRWECDKCFNKSTTFTLPFNHLDEDEWLNFHELKLNEIDVPSSFGLFHANTASLNLHIDDLRLILSRLKYKFDVIGISEHKFHKDKAPSNNIKVTGYKEFVFEPTEITHGGTGFYVKEGVDFINRRLAN